jgi:eukaryotic-like serine/threonine-protein kinase
MNAPPLVPKTVIAGRYEVGEVLGAGGMARVYRARDLRLDREVALKILPPAASAELEARFRREARNAAHLDHPGCVRVFESGRAEDGSYFLAMERLDGPTLREEMARGPMPVERAVAIARQLLDGLAHAHASGLLHRDLKPENVMLRGSGPERRAVLIDFGLSELEGDAALTAAGSCVGSPAYLAPERILGNGYDGRADVYAVGVMLFEMITGERLFVGDSPLETARMHLQRAAPSLSSLRPEVSAALDAACAAALEKQPERRFASAEQMAAALAAPLATIAAEARDAVDREAPAPWWRRALARLGAQRPRAELCPTLSLAGSGAFRFS